MADLNKLSTPELIQGALIAAKMAHSRRPTDDMQQAIYTLDNWRRCPDRASRAALIDFWRGLMRRPADG